MVLELREKLEDFNPRAPCGARLKPVFSLFEVYPISTHAPLAGRDDMMAANGNAICISTHAPLAGRDDDPISRVNAGLQISTHAPLAGRDTRSLRRMLRGIISTHAPLAGRDQKRRKQRQNQRRFQPTRPLRGATDFLRQCERGERFQPTRPLRGATSLESVFRLSLIIFQPTRPLRGATGQIRRDHRRDGISTHAPLAGRDSKSVQITMHIFAITDKFQMLLHRMPPVRAFCSFLMQENHADFGCEPPK